MEQFVDNYAPSSAMSWADFYNMRGHQESSSWITANPESLGARITNFFGGQRDRYKAEYDQYIDELNRENDYKATQSARAWELWLESTKYQRAVEDLKKAGLNPWLLAQSGSLSAQGTTSAQKAESKYGKKEDVKNSNAGRNVALFLLATAKIIATLMA